VLDNQAPNPLLDEEVLREEVPVTSSFECLDPCPDECPDDLRLLDMVLVTA
jgi:hypothetical protein